MNKIKVGSDFSGVGAFDQALKRLEIDYETIFACDMDKHARKTFIHNYGEPKYYPENVYDREIPKESLDIYMTSPPCQAFSLAGKRKGEQDERGILFYNSHEFIKVNKPRYFIFENVKGLLSDNGGKTFGRWIELLGGKSVNGNQVIFTDENSVPYHIYWKVLNAKNYGVPQNRERVFIIGIRDDVDNNFLFPKEQPLIKRLKDVLENEVNEKYYLSDKGVEYVYKKEGVYTGINEDPIRCLTTRYSASIAGTFLKVKSATSKGHELAQVGEDSINFEHPNSDTRRGRVSKKVAQTLTTSCNQGVAIIDDIYKNREERIYKEFSPTIRSERQGLKVKSYITKDNEFDEIIQYEVKQKVKLRKNKVDIIKLQKVLKLHKKASIKKIAEILNKPKTEVEHWFRTDKCFSIPDADIWFRLKGLLSIDTDEFDCQITEFIEKDNEFESANRIYDERGISPTLTCTDTDKKIINNDYRIRKLTPRECFRFMDFPDSFDFSVVSDSQAYKQAGNSIVVNVLAEIIKKLNLKERN